jgi:hypothetical protein
MNDAKSSYLYSKLLEDYKYLQMRYWMFRMLIWNRGLRD